MLADHRAKYGNAGLGSLIISMTRCVEDMLVVFILAREAGLMTWSDEGLVCPLPVVPLFETMGDLEEGRRMAGCRCDEPRVGAPRMGTRET